MMVSSSSNSPRSSAWGTGWAEQGVGSSVSSVGGGAQGQGHAQSREHSESLIQGWSEQEAVMVLGGCVRFRELEVGCGVRMCTEGG